MQVSDGDVIHADQHGAVVIPYEVCGDVKQAAELIGRRERLVISAAQQPGFDVEALRRAQREAAEM
jgi:regulator of RNase E activity RraA